MFGICCPSLGDLGQCLSDSGFWAQFLDDFWQLGAIGPFLKGINYQDYV